MFQIFKMPPQSNFIKALEVNHRLQPLPLPGPPRPPCCWLWPPLPAPRPPWLLPPATSSMPAHSSNIGCPELVGWPGLSCVFEVLVPHSFPVGVFWEAELAPGGAGIGPAVLGTLPAGLLFLPAGTCSISLHVIAIFNHETACMHQTCFPQAAS